MYARTLTCVHPALLDGTSHTPLPRYTGSTAVWHNCYTIPTSRYKASSAQEIDTGVQVKVLEPGDVAQQVIALDWLQSCLAQDRIQGHTRGNLSVSRTTEAPYILLRWASSSFLGRNVHAHRTLCTGCG